MSSASRRPGESLDRLTAAAPFALGLVLRLVIFRGPAGEPNADEVIIGLMGRSALAGEPAVFYWGQSYDGTLEVPLVGVLVALLGCTRALRGMQGINVGNTPATAPAIAALQTRGGDRAYAPYWTAWRLTWDSAERVIASSVPWRHILYLEAVRAAQAPGPAFVFVHGTSQSAQVLAELERIGVGYALVTVPGYDVVIPHRRVTDSESVIPYE